MLALMAMMLLAIAAVSYGVGSQEMSRRDQNWNASLSSAEGGLDDFVFRLNENANYSAYNAGNPPPDGNTAFGAYTLVAGGNTTSKFRYTTDTSKLPVDGTIKVTATGLVGKSKRTLEATVRRRSFLDYLYFTDFETVDPALYTGTPYTPAQAQANCATYYYTGRELELQRHPVHLRRQHQRSAALERRHVDLWHAALQRRDVHQLDRAPRASGGGTV